MHIYVICSSEQNEMEWESCKQFYDYDKFCGGLNCCNKNSTLYQSENAWQRRGKVTPQSLRSRFSIRFRVHYVSANLLRVVRLMYHVRHILFRRHVGTDVPHDTTLVLKRFLPRILPVAHASCHAICTIVLYWVLGDTIMSLRTYEISQTIYARRGCSIFFAETHFMCLPFTIRQWTSMYCIPSPMQ